MPGLFTCNEDGTGSSDPAPQKRDSSPCSASYWSGSFSKLNLVNCLIGDILEGVESNILFFLKHCFKPDWQSHKKIQMSSFHSFGEISFWNRISGRLTRSVILVLIMFAGGTIPGVRRCAVERWKQKSKNWDQKSTNVELGPDNVPTTFSMFVANRLTK